MHVALSGAGDPVTPEDLGTLRGLSQGPAEQPETRCLESGCRRCFVGGYTCSSGPRVSRVTVGGAQSSWQAHRPCGRVTGQWPSEQQGVPTGGARANLAIGPAPLGVAGTEAPRAVLWGPLSGSSPSEKGLDLSSGLE